MTTVINFNFLNFFGLKVNSTSVTTEVRSYSQYLDNRQYPDRNREGSGDVIDITPSRKSLPGSGTGEVIQSYDHITKAYLSGAGLKEGTYNRKGKAVPHTFEKGLLIDSYV